MDVRNGLLIAALAIALGGGAAWAEPVKLRLAWIVTPPELEPVLFEKAGLAKHLGASYTLEPIHFQGTSAMITGLAAGEIDIAPLAYPSFAIAIINAKMSDLRIIGDEFRDGVGDYFSAEYLVRQDAPIKSVEDLRGKVLATNGIGTANHIGMIALLNIHHLVPPKDFTVIEIPLPSMKAVLLDKKADLIGTSPLLASDPELRAASRVLYTEKDSMGPSQMTFFTARAPFLAQHRAAIVDFLEDEVAALRWYLDPANRAEAIAILARFSKMPPARLDNWVFTKRDYFRDPNGLPDLDILQKNLDTELELGLIKEKVEVRKYGDLSLVREAAQRLARK